MSKELLPKRQWQVLDISPDAIVLVKQDGVIAYFNSQAEQLFGYTRAEVLGKKLELLIPAEFREVHVSSREKYNAKPRSYCVGKMREVLALRKDQLEWPVDVVLRPVEMDDGSMLVCASVRDASLRLQREEALQASERRNRELLETMNEGFGEVDRDYVFTYVNSKFCDMLGYAKEEMMGKPLLDFVYEDGKERMKEQIALRKHGVQEQHEMSFANKNGDRVYVLASPKIIYDDNGDFNGSFGVLTDLTDLKKDEFALKASESRYRNLIETIPYGIQESNLDGVITFSNTALNMMFGYAEGDIQGKMIWDFSCDNDERQRMHEHYEFLISNRPSPSPFFAQCKTSSGNIIDVQVDWNYKFNDAGKLSGFVCIITDITDRKKAEEGLQLASLVFQNSSEGMVVTNADNEIIAINPAYTNITGYRFNEVQGKNPSVFQSGYHDREFYQAMWHELLTSGQWQGEVWDKRKNGEIFAKWIMINTILNQDGSIHRYVALFSDITEKKQSEELIWRQANFDLVTELPNRNMFREHLMQEIMRSKCAGRSLALLLIDLDQFKEVNDTLGHDVGDTLLQEAAHRISACLRDTDMVARLGGDEFTIILSELEDIGHIEYIANILKTKLAEAYHLGDEIVYVSASIGITVYPDDAQDIDALMKNADQAMYAAKKKGRNCFSYFTQSLQDSAHARLRLKNDLRSALIARQFSIYFQPIVDLSTGRIYKAEALLRWRHPGKGMVDPVDFIPLAEETDLIHDIGDWVLKESVRWVKYWGQQFDQNFKVSVNMSPVQFRVEAKDFATRWREHLQELALSGENIIIEITEGLLLKAEMDISEKLHSMRDAGIQVAIDDFGTGYSSLAYIKKFNIDYLKIDKTFVRNLEVDANDIALCEAIIVMAHKLGIKVIAEGVETSGQQKLLMDAGCDFSQGFLYSKPVPPEKFEVLLQGQC